jgi:hypothetical protein
MAERQITILNEPGGRIADRFHGRDLNLVLGPRADGEPVRFTVSLDVDKRGTGTISEERLYQLIRQDRPITDCTFQITFIDAGAQAYVFTFG